MSNYFGSLGAAQEPSAIKPKSRINILGMLGAAGGAYHGYKRNRSVRWAIAWGFLGALSPLITGAVAAAQGFGKRK